MRLWVSLGKKTIVSGTKKDRAETMEGEETGGPLLKIVKEEHARYEFLYASVQRYIRNTRQETVRAELTRALGTGSHQSHQPPQPVPPKE